jgi:hypothetical protein
MQMIGMEFPAFETADLPPSQEIMNFVYVLGVEDSNKGFAPFYVGQTSRLLGRIDDYAKANFSASTDFKVGEAIKYFQMKGFKIQLKFRKYENPEEEERRIASEIEQERGKELLLNNLKGYDYKVDNKEHQRLEVHRFVDNFLEHLRTLAP